MLIAVPVLLRCAIDGAAMLPEGGWRSLCFALVPVVSILGYLLMDFIFARAFGGLLALCANYLIAKSFANDVACRPLYCTIALLLGLAGMILIAWPWWMRDFCDFRNRLPARRKPLLFIATLCLALPLLILPFIH